MIILSRVSTAETKIISSQKPFVFAGKIDTAYRSIFTDRTMFLSTDDNSPKEIVDEAIARSKAFRKQA